MIKILHAADLHLDSPFAGRTEEQGAFLRGELAKVPEKIADMCKNENCDLLLLAGDIFDGVSTRESCRKLQNALEDVKIPVFISTGNHDFCSADSPWMTQLWPKNVHIFKNQRVENVCIPELDCRIYGAGFSAMDCPALLEDFKPVGTETYHIGLFHGDPMQADSHYNPVSQHQVAASGLSYLALGHIHKGGAFRAGKTLCAWPGCPMGRGFDEAGEKGVLTVTLEEEASTRFVPLDTPRFFDWEAEVSAKASDAVTQLLPAVGNRNFYRITLTGECEKPNISKLLEEFSDFPNLLVRDRTQLPVDVWGSAGADSLEGLYFQMLRQCFDEAEGEDREVALLAAKLSKKILDGSEVVLP